MRDAESRYSRQSRFAPLGEAGQQRISSARVALVGLGALGSVQAELLARAGVGTLRLLDRDFVEASNLQRQTLYDEADAAEALPKAVAAARRLARVNSSIQLEPVVADLTPQNCGELLEGMDLILDGTDNFEARYLINDFAVQQGIPWIYGAAVGSYGIKLAIVPERTACFRCVYPESPRGAQPTCETDGVLGPVTAAVAALQAADALKILARGVEAAVSRPDHDGCLDWRDPPNRFALPPAIPIAHAVFGASFRTWKVNIGHPLSHVRSERGSDSQERSCPVDLAERVAPALEPPGVSAGE